MSMLLLMDDSFLPYDLFRASEQGIWLDPSDFSTLFQDSAGTTPVTAVGQPVGLIRDKSGRGNHASQSTAASRPTLQQDSNGLYYLSFDGTDDGMATPSINFTGTDKMTVWAGVRKLSDAARGMLLELGNATTNSFAIQAPDANAADRFAFTSTGATSRSSLYTIAAPVTAVITGLGDISGDSVRFRVNGVEATPNTADQGAGAYGNHILYIGRRGGTTLPFNGRIYQLIVRGAESNAGQIAATEAYVNAKTRAY